MSAIIKTDDLTPGQINALVAVAEGWLPPNHPDIDRMRREYRERNGTELPRSVWRDPAGFHDNEPRNYCGDHRRGGEIIDRELISILYDRNLRDWMAGYNLDLNDGTFAGPWSAGKARLEAAMRAYVRKIHGDTIRTADKPWLLEAAAR